MSFLSKLKKKVNYEHNVPRCAICANFQKSKVVLTTDSMTKRINHHCNRHGFSVALNSVCDTWVGVDGDILEHSE
jgi:hypothetical protein